MVRKVDFDIAKDTKVVTKVEEPKSDSPKKKIERREKLTSREPTKEKNGLEMLNKSIVENLLFKMAKMKMCWNRCCDGKLALGELKKINKELYEEALSELKKHGINSVSPV